MKKINIYSSNSKNILTGTKWQSLLGAKLFFEGVRGVDTYSFEDRNGNEGFFCRTVRTNTYGESIKRVTIFIEE